MPPALAAFVDTALSTWRGLSRRMQMLAIAAVVTGLVSGGAVWALSTWFADYQVLFSSLSSEDSAAVVDALRAGKVPYRVGEGGQILVPAGRVHEWRLKLAGQGVPSGGGVGFEIFDKNQFGLTDFAQRLNFQRALQGELARTIGQLREVQQARVHLALPAPRVFSSQDRAASASVVLKLRPGSTLRPDQVRGIVHLVTASVEGLSPDRVTVVDSSGRMLMSGLDRVGGLSTTQQEARQTIESEVERRIQTLLDPVVGAGRSAVRVAALVNFDQIERTEERFDPRTLVRSQVRSTENSQGSSSQPTGTPPPPPSNPTTAAPVPPAPQAISNTRTQRENEQTTYEIARTVERTVVAPGDVKRLSVAVLLDIPVVNGTRTPRTDEELDRLKRLVTSAAGVRADRKDELEVVQVPFDPTAGVPGDTALATRETPAPAARPVPVVYWLAAGVVAAIFILAFIVWRARRRQVAFDTAVGATFDGRNVLPEPEAAAAPAAAPTFAENDVDLMSPNVLQETPLRRRVLTAAQEHPDEVAALIRAWMFKRRTTLAS